MQRKPRRTPTTAISLVLEIAGGLAVLYAVSCVWLPAAIALGGVLLILAAQSVDREVTR